MNTYSAYKDSGEQWLGQIPEHWEIRKSKYVWREKNAVSSTGNEQLLSVSQYEGVRPSNESSRSESCKGYKIVEKDDLVINIMLAWLGGLGVSNYEGIVSPAYCIYKPLIDVNTKYLHYLYKTPMYLAEFARHSTGVVPSRWRMYTDDFGQVLTVLPPKEEQEAMVAYLDEQTGKLDQAIAREQKMIDLLEERKQIIIQHAVTKGLNTNAKMKDSGIDWIGEIPEGWKVIKTARVFYHIGSGTTPSSSNVDYYAEEGFNWLQTGDLNNADIFKTAKHITSKAVREKSMKFYPIDSLVVAMYGATIGKVGLLKIETSVNQACCVLPPTSKMDMRYAKYLYISAKPALIRESEGGGQPNISQQVVRNLRIPVPPKDEQQSIVSYLDEHLVEINRAIDAREKMIALLQERKQIIINEVVTGKIKVL